MSGSVISFLSIWETSRDELSSSFSKSTSDCSATDLPKLPGIPSLKQANTKAAPNSVHKKRTNSSTIARTNA